LGKIYPLSTENSENKLPPNPDEIDFGPIINWFATFFKKLKLRFTSWLNIILKKGAKIILISIVSATLAVALSYAINPFYRSESIFLARNIESELHFTMIAHLEELLLEENHEEVASVLGISVENTKKIHSLEYEMNKKEIRDSTKKEKLFKIAAEVYNNDVLDTLENSLLNYLSSIPTVKRNVNLQKQKLEQLIRKLEKEIISLDSVSEIVSNSIVPRSNGTGLIYGEPINPVEVHQEKIRLFERKLEYEISLSKLDSVELVNGFTHYKKPAFPKKTSFAIFGFLSALILAVIYYSRRKDQG
jgi:hypothetical protein